MTKGVVHKIVILSILKFKIKYRLKCKRKNIVCLKELSLINTLIVILENFSENKEY